MGSAGQDITANIDPQPLDHGGHELEKFAAQQPAGDLQHTVVPYEPYEAFLRKSAALSGDSQTLDHAVTGRAHPLERLFARPNFHIVSCSTLCVGCNHCEAVALR
jgi:hypothetical protein